MTFAPLAQVIRSGFVESVHFGCAVAVDGGGSAVLRVGDPDAVLLPRSALKPLQAVAMVRAGLELTGPQLALAAASHSGQPFHLAVVAEILDRGGLTAADLDNTPDLPLDPAERRDWQCAGRAAEPLAQNCSGKHAAMLVTCVLNGW